MPNNSHARREKEKKKQSKKKKTDSLLLRKEDKASKDKAGLDSVAHSLSLSGQDRAIMDTSSPSSLSLAGDEDVNQLYVRGPAQKALLDEFRLSTTEDQRAAMYNKLSEEYPESNAKELARSHRTAMVTAALEARRRKIQDAQPKSNEPPVRANSFALTLTKEEKRAVFDATKSANPNADFKTFNEALGVAVWKADNQKRGIISGGSLGAVDISLSSETDDKGGSDEDSDSSEDGLQLIRDDLLRQQQVSPPPLP
jgi:hypothetical protein